MPDYSLLKQSEVQGFGKIGDIFFSYLSFSVIIDQVTLPSVCKSFTPGEKRINLCLGKIKIAQSCTVMR